MKARDIYLSLVAKGWSATLAELAPKSAVEAVQSELGPTVGEFIAEVERTSNLKTKTFRRYAQYFRMLAAQIQGVKTDASRYNYHGGGLTRWHERVDAIPLGEEGQLQPLHRRFNSSQGVAVNRNFMRGENQS